MEHANRIRPKLSWRGAVQLAAPHTWPAAVLPVLLGGALSWADGFPARPWLLLCTMAVGVLLQSAVNTLNDYRDFVSGLDTEENCTDPTDAALIYECSSPTAALLLGLVFLLGAALLGLTLVFYCGSRLLAYGGLGLAAILLYVMPAHSLSDLPVGELLSGGTMGGILTCAAYRVQAGTLSPEAALLCLPAVATIGCIMLANNTSDIEKDRPGGRKTLAVCIGRIAAQRLLRGAEAASAAAVLLIVLLRFPAGAAVLPVLPVIFAVAPWSRDLFTAPVIPERRGAAMRAVLGAHVWINGVYVTAVTLSCVAG